jgi:hypothetical protein
MVTGSFGNFSTTYTDPTYVSMADDTNYGTWFVMPTAGSVTKITVWMLGDLGWAQCAIYDYAPGSALRGVTGSVLVDSYPNYQYKFVDFLFPGSLGLPAGSYVLCANCSVSDNIWIRYTSGLNRSAYVSDNFPITLTSWTGGAGDFTEDYLYAYKAEYEVVGGETPSNMKINIGDSWKTVKPYINIGDSWKSVTAKVNIGDAWK